MKDNIVQPKFTINFLAMLVHLLIENQKKFFKTSFQSILVFGSLNYACSLRQSRDKKKKKTTLEKLPVNKLQVITEDELLTNPFQLEWK